MANLTFTSVNLQCPTAVNAAQDNAGVAENRVARSEGARKEVVEIESGAI